jgi:Rrf2 family protein
MRTSLFSAKTEYACIAMLELAAQYGDSQPVRLKLIADAHEIPERFLVQILLQLKDAGLVMSARGASGGYLLARSPEKISVADIVGVVDRHDRTIRSATERKKNSVKIDSMPHTNAVLAIRALWNDLEANQRKLLEQITLVDLVRRTHKNFALSYNI